MISLTVRLLGIVALFYFVQCGAGADTVERHKYWGDKDFQGSYFIDTEDKIGIPFINREWTVKYPGVSFEHNALSSFSKIVFYASNYRGWPSTDSIWRTASFVPLNCTRNQENLVIHRQLMWLKVASVKNLQQWRSLHPPDVAWMHVSHLPFKKISCYWNVFAVKCE